MTEEEVVEVPKVEEDWKDKYLRSLAEMENMRKRMQKERQEIARFGIENAIGAFLPAIDNFENALRFAESAGPEVKNWAIGFEMILSEFKEVLHNHGIVSFHSEGNTFDAGLHEAVEIVETSEVPDGTILHEFTKGYKSAHRTVRPARVKVAKRPQVEKLDLPSVEENLT
jgi:molecular chaperone GrpE